MQNTIRRRIKTALLSMSCIVAIGSGAAFAQSGSAGGSIGNDEKSMSGSRSVEPERPARRSKPESEEPRQSASRRSGGGEGGGAGNFDGAWAVTSMGTPCGSASSAIVVTSGKIIGQSGVIGSVSASGAAHAVANSGGITIVSSGRFSGRSGSGTFKRSDGCVGTWAVSKQ